MTTEGLAPDRLPFSAAPDRRALSRREFLRISAGSIAGTSVALAGGQHLFSPAFGYARVPHSAVPRNALRLAPELYPYGTQLVAAPGSADIGAGVSAPGFLINGSLPSPLLRVRRGDTFDVTMVNQLEDELILHWHGLTPPEESDGHPHLAVRPGNSYHYRFELANRAGTYWYHSHAHLRVGLHTQMGIAGMIIVNDEEEDALHLPSGAREIPIILQDRQLGNNGLPEYKDVDLMHGFHGVEAFGNGIHRPTLDVETALYRFRILNGANARIFRLQRSDNVPLTLIGNDGGLLERSAHLQFVDVSPGERVDLLIDFRANPVGSVVHLRSVAFDVRGKGNPMRSANVNDVTLDMLDLKVLRAVRDDSPIPSALRMVARPDPAKAVRERTFRFTFTRDPARRAMEVAAINGKVFDMHITELVVPFGETEIWNFVNDAAFPHPVHVHATHFRILSRTGGRGQVFPWEEGLKDTVLLYPDESVRVAVRFSAHRGRYLIHCHNLEHEDAGMMLNFLVD